MHIVDLTHSLAPGMPVYPGSEPPLFTPVCLIEEVGFREQKLTFFSHTGTHIDAPAHILKEAKTLDLLPIDQFTGQAVALKAGSADQPVIEIIDLKPHENAIKSSNFLLLHTGWSRFWDTNAYFTGYPVLSLAAAAWLGRFDLKGIGMDTISADTADATDFPIHKTLLNREMIIIENLTNLDRLPPGGFTFSCFPLKIQQADGSPVRAVAMLPDSITAANP